MTSCTSHPRNELIPELRVSFKTVAVRRNKIGRLAKRKPRNGVRGFKPVSANVSEGELGKAYRISVERGFQV